MLALVLFVCLLLIDASRAEKVISRKPSHFYMPVLDAWIHQQAERSWSHTLENISPRGALKGMIVASLSILTIRDHHTSTSKPDYYYSWTRDAAIVSKELVLRYEESNDPQLLALIKQTISAAQVLQSASFGSYASLGEPKYYVNGSAFTGPWGRPQRDGPALRATIYIRFALAYMRVGGVDALHYVKNFLYDDAYSNSRSVIKADLDYICNTWSERSFDLWEEVNGYHFFTLSVIHRALEEGSKFAEKMQDLERSRRYKKQATKIESQLPSFWDLKSGYLRASLNVTDSHGKKSGLDVGTLLGCLHAGKEMPSQFRPESTMMVNTFHAVLNSMSHVYPLNKRYENLIAKAVGRYPEDIYDGVSTSIANPWFIATLTMAEYLYRLDSKGISIYNNTNPTNYNQKKISSRQIADQFVHIVKNSVVANGSIHEQFGRVDGLGLGARDLTWSHVSFLSMYRARNHLPEF